MDLVKTANGGFYIRIVSGLPTGEPLYVIDGTRMNIDPKRGIDWFTPEDIARIQVLKNPADVAVYGPRGGNGVVLITTKQTVRRRYQFRSAVTPPSRKV